MTQHTDKISGEINIDLMEEIIKTFPSLKSIYSTDHSILIHGMGGQSRGFYNNLRHNKAIELIWTGWSSKIWWTYLLSFIPGQAGLTKVIDRQQLDKLYLDIGAQSMCGLYFIPTKLEQKIIDIIKKERTPDIIDILKNETDYFLLTIDFDYHGGENDGEIFYREIVLGESINDEIKRILIRTK